MVKKEFIAANKLLNDAYKKLDQWNNIYGSLHTLEGVEEYNRQCIRQGHNKYKEHYIEHNGWCTKLRSCAHLYRILNSLILKALSVPALELIADEFVHYEQDAGTPLFSNYFLSILKPNIPMT